MGAYSAEFEPGGPSLRIRYTMFKKTMLKLGLLSALVTTLLLIWELLTTSPHSPIPRLPLDSSQWPVLGTFALLILGLRHPVWMVISLALLLVFGWSHEPWLFDIFPEHRQALRARLPDPPEWPFTVIPIPLLALESLRRENKQAKSATYFRRSQIISILAWLTLLCELAGRLEYWFVWVSAPIFCTLAYALVASAFLLKTTLEGPKQSLETESLESANPGHLYSLP